MLNWIVSDTYQYLEPFNSMQIKLLLWNIWNHLVELLVLQYNTWNHLTANEWIVLNSIKFLSMCWQMKDVELLMFCRNTWNNLTVFKQIINSK